MDWKQNLDSWKSRRRKMSEDVFRRQEEIRQVELEQQQQILEALPKKTKTFSEIIESRKGRSRALSCCLLSSPLELQKWDLENNNSTNNGTHSYSEGSEENSAVNSEDEGIGVKGMQKNLMNEKSQSAENILSNGSPSKNKFFELGRNGLSPNNGSYFDSGLESISSSHRAGDTPDSCSDFSQDSGSCIDGDSPRVSSVLNGVNLLEEFNAKDFQDANSHNSSKLENGTEVASQINSNRKSEEFDLQSEKGTSISDDTCSIASNNKFGKEALLNKQNQTKDISRDSHSHTSSTSDQFSENSYQKQERSVESENEVFVDDFEELNTNEKPALNSHSAKLDGSDVSCNDQKKDSLQSLTSHSDLFAIKVAIVVQTTDEGSDEIVDLDENKSSTAGLSSSISCDSENCTIDVSNTFTSKQITSPTEEENTNVVVKIKKPKNKNSKKKKETKITSNENSSNQKSNVPLIDDDLNIVFQSQPIKKIDDVVGKSNSQIKEQVILKDVPPVEQVAEEMERLILQQLEEEERAKELSIKMTSESIFDSPEHNLVFRSCSAEPPKEKPPPPPCADNDSPKATSLKRVNSTKRIKKEICKRRSNFLGIENDKDSVTDEFTIPPPPALEQILKAEMELDRESRKKLESATTERLILEENEIRKREQEIIEIMETEERQKQLIINCDDYSDVKSDCTEVCDIIQEGDRIEILKEERKRMEKERRLSEEQRLRLIEEKQLKEREELIKKQEAVKPILAELSAPPLSGIAKLPNATNIASLSSPDSKLNVTDLDVNGEGNNNSDQIKSKLSEKQILSDKPTVPPKPLKKKEAIRKERERLRQEQEALVREREEHRRKLKEEEELLKSQKSHASEAPVSRLGPLPSLIKPAYTPQLTSPISAQPSIRENAAVNRNYYAAQNGMPSNNNCVEPASHTVVNKRNKPIPPPKKTVKSELRNQQKVLSVRKQPHEPLTESKYNQNHWLIQEAEMRRITELKERQRVSQYVNSQTHLAEDDVCSVSTRASVLSPSMHLNNPVQEKVWNHGHSNIPAKKYSPLVGSDKPVGTYTIREQPPTKPSRVVPLERQEQMLSVSGRKRCSHCNEELGRGAAMIIESLQLYYHIHCFQCCVCQAQLGNGSCGTDVRVRNNKLHCHNCYSNDEAGLKFSQV